jgi:hypothetical protein
MKQLLNLFHGNTVWYTKKNYGGFKMFKITLVVENVSNGIKVSKEMEIETLTAFVDTKGRSHSDGIGIFSFQMKKNASNWRNLKSLDITAEDVKKLVAIDTRQMELSFTDNNVNQINLIMEKSEDDEDDNGITITAEKINSMSQAEFMEYLNSDII